ncbi:protein-L-isoaspartate O-methyltransferase family protein [Aeromicrobium sp.]|uniref:protein-L-isoaspartate O-methyltransferase family protein n=1 Tax=Aeromicrobium sp. TaxID=1871063 RepID=UPI003D6B7410
MSIADVDAAFAAIDRAEFLHPRDRVDADFDGPIPIGHGQTNSQPRTVRAMLELLDVRPGQKILDVGSGSGWTTALLARLVGPAGSVLGVELEPDLAAWGAENLGRQDTPWASIRPADPEVLGIPAESPFDRVLVSAAARKLPDALVEQLTDDGVMVVPVNATMTRVRRTGPDPGDADISAHGAYSFVPLR